MLNHHKSRQSRTSESRLFTLVPKGMESGSQGYFYVAANGRSILGSQMTPKVPRSIYGAEPGKPNALPEVVGRSSARKDEGVLGRGNGKKQRATCNGLHRDGCLNLKGCRLVMGVSIVRMEAKL